MDDDEIEEITGYLYTHWDCDACGETNETEGDRSGEDVKCTACDCVSHIGKVM